MEIQTIIANRIEIRDVLKNILIEDLNLNMQAEDIPDDAILFGGGIGLDSIDALQLIVGVEAKTGVLLPQDQPGVIRSINTIIDYILKTKNQNVDAYQLNRVAVEQYQELYDGDYYAVRHAASAIHNTDKFILKFSGDGVLDVLDYLVTGTVSRLAENGILQTLMLKDDGSIGAFVEVYNDFDVFYLIANLANKDFILKQCEKAKNNEISIEDMSTSYTIITLTGPNVPQIIEKALGNDISGLRNLMFAHAQCDEADIIAARVSQTGEFSYVLIAPNNTVDTLIAHLENSSESKIKRCNLAILPLLSLEACIYNENNYHTKNPLALNLHWTIDFNKESFLGRDGLLAQKQLSNNDIVIPFYAEGVDQPLTPSMTIKIAQQDVGRIEHVVFSPILGKYIGLLHINAEFAFPGVSAECETNNGKINLRVISAPFFATDSHLAIGG